MTLGPNLAKQNAMYRVLDNREPFRNLFGLHATGSKPANRSYLFNRENRAMIGGTTTSTTRSVLAMSIGGVVLSRSDKKMCRINARWHVTVMTDTKTIRDRAICHYPR